MPATADDQGWDDDLAPPMADYLEDPFDFGEDRPPADYQADEYDGADDVDDTPPACYFDEPPVGYIGDDEDHEDPPPPTSFDLPPGLWGDDGEDLWDDDGVAHDRFGGRTYDPVFDYERLNKQMRRVYDLMKDGGWRTLAEIRAVTGDPEASISARLRDLRKPKFGDFVVDRRRRGNGYRGLHEYRLVAR